MFSYDGRIGLAETARDCSDFEVGLWVVVIVPCIIRVDMIRGCKMIHCFGIYTTCQAWLVCRGCDILRDVVDDFEYRKAVDSWLSVFILA